MAQSSLQSLGNSTKNIWAGLMVGFHRTDTMNIFESVQMCVSIIHKDKRYEYSLNEPAMDIALVFRSNLVIAKVGLHLEG